jgi:hypothetical protein
MTFSRHVSLWIAAALVLLVCGPAAATQYWELVPVRDPNVAIGSHTVVGGKTSPDGVNFTLKNNSTAQPLALTLIAVTSGARLHLSAFKEDGQSFLDKDTDEKGLLKIKFRTGDTIDFKVTGPAGTTYQLSLWRGPAISLPPPDPVATMDEVTGRAESAGAAPVKGTSNATAPLPVTGNSNVLIYILLAGIMVALIVIAFLIYRGQQLRGKP